MHRKKTYAKHIRKWLNFEWKRLGKGKVEGADTPFYENGMVLCAPKSKFSLLPKNLFHVPFALTRLHLF